MNELDDLNIGRLMTNASVHLCVAQIRVSALIQLF